jgi:hypothetical protein
VLWCAVACCAAGREGLLRSKEGGVLLCGMMRGQAAGSDLLHRGRLNGVHNPSSSFVCFQHWWEACRAQGRPVCAHAPALLCRCCFVSLFFCARQVGSLQPTAAAVPGLRRRPAAAAVQGLPAAGRGVPAAAAAVWCWCCWQFVQAPSTCVQELIHCSQHPQRAGETRA